MHSEEDPWQIAISHFTSFLPINYKQLFANVRIIHLNIAVLNIYNSWNTVGQQKVWDFLMTFCVIECQHS